MPKVSVIIPTYNRAEFLRSAILSVLNQTFQDFEIVVVDDASMDNTAEIISSFNDKRIKYIQHEINKGEAKARNTGVMNSTGKYIAFLDDDDEWLPTKLSLQVDLLENSPPIIGGVYTGYKAVDRNNGAILAQRVPTKRGYIYNDILTRNLIGATSTVLLRRECLEIIGPFDENIAYGLDHDMWIRISKEFHFECIKKPLVKYYIHENKLSTDYRLMIRGKETILKKYSQLLALNKKSCSYHYLKLGEFYCYSGNTKKGREALFKAIKLYPFNTKSYFNFFLSLLGADNFKKLREVKRALVIPRSNAFLPEILRAKKFVQFLTRLID